MRRAQQRERLGAVGRDHPGSHRRPGCRRGRHASHRALPPPEWSQWSLTCDLLRGCGPNTAGPGPARVRRRAQPLARSIRGIARPRLPRRGDQILGGEPVRDRRPLAVRSRRRWRARAYGPSSPMITARLLDQRQPSTRPGGARQPRVVLLAALVCERGQDPCGRGVHQLPSWGRCPRAIRTRTGAGMGLAAVSLTRGGRCCWLARRAATARRRRSARRQRWKLEPTHRRANRCGHRQLRGAQQHLHGLRRLSVTLPRAGVASSGEYHPADVTRVVLCIHGIRTDAKPIPWRQELDAALRLEGLRDLESRGWTTLAPEYMGR